MARSAATWPSIWNPLGLPQSASLFRNDRLWSVTTKQAVATLRSCGAVAQRFSHDVAKSEDAPLIIFSMLGVSKKIERKEILRDISLSFYYGAKIGVLG